MPRLSFDDYLDEESIRLGSRQQPAQKSASASARKKAIRNVHAVLDEEAQKGILNDLGAAEVFTPSLGASRHEREWIFTYLGPFYDNQVLVDVLRRVKGGKEANVYVCSAHPSTGLDLLAAKIYRPRMFRNLRNDARYRYGRAVLDEDGKGVHNEHVLHAIAKGSSYGKELRQVSWMQHEFTTIELLHGAGLPVPKPVTMGENTILMEYIGGLDLPAPALNEVALPRNAAKRIFDTLIAAIEGMLSCGRIHADLSAYNVLIWEDKPVIIDFPQAVDPRTNPDSWPIFYRDVERICDYFKKYAIRVSPVDIASAIWKRQKNQKYQPEYPIPPEPDEDQD
jgi:RIO kinase 1